MFRLRCLSRSSTQVMQGRLSSGSDWERPEAHFYLYLLFLVILFRVTLKEDCLMKDDERCDKKVNLFPSIRTSFFFTLFQIIIHKTSSYIINRTSIHSFNYIDAILNHCNCKHDLPTSLHSRPLSQASAIPADLIISV